MRDDFPNPVKERLAKRVGYRCSNPGCRRPTSGPQVDPSKAINLGVAAHISAAAPGGPRYDGSLAATTRRAAENGIWLCQACAKLVDSDSARYTVDLLMVWKAGAERVALAALERRGATEGRPSDDPLAKVERLMPELVAEMREDLRQHPLGREFVLLQKAWTYWPKGNELVYFYDDHVDLDSKMRILQNVGLVQEITYNNTKRYIFTESFVDWLNGSS
jgi:hypothetical protein